MKEKKIFTPNSTKLCYDNNITFNKQTNNNEQLTYICGVENSQIETTSTMPLKSTRGAKSSGVHLDEIYKDGRRKIRQQEKIFYIGLSLTGASKTGRRSLNVDIITEPGTKPFKYIAKLAPYEVKHGVFQNKPPQTVNWDGWDWCYNLYKEHKHNAYFGKLVQRTTYTKTLSRTIAPMCLAGVVADFGIVAHIKLFDKTYTIPMHEVSVKDGKQHVIFVARADYYEEWNDGEYDADELEEL
jgi:hypothetical protein